MLYERRFGESRLLHDNLCSMPRRYVVTAG